MASAPVLTLAECHSQVVEAENTARKRSSGGVGPSFAPRVQCSTVVVVMQSPRQPETKRTKYGERKYCSVVVGDSSQRYCTLASWGQLVDRIVKLSPGDVLFCSDVLALLFRRQVSLSTGYSSSIRVLVSSNTGTSHSLSKQSCLDMPGLPAEVAHRTWDLHQTIARPIVSRPVHTTPERRATTHLARGARGAVSVSDLKRIEEEALINILSATVYKRSVMAGGEGCVFEVSIWCAEEGKNGGFQHIRITRPWSLDDRMDSEEVRLGGVYDFKNLQVKYSLVFEELVLSWTGDSKASISVSHTKNLYCRPKSIADLHSMDVLGDQMVLIGLRLHKIVLRTPSGARYTVDCRGISVCIDGAFDEIGVKRKRYEHPSMKSYEESFESHNAGRKLCEDAVYMACARCRKEILIDVPGLSGLCCPGSVVEWQYRPLQLYVSDSVADVKTSSNENTICIQAAHSALQAVFSNISPALLVADARSEFTNTIDEGQGACSYVYEEDKAVESWRQEWLEMCHALTDLNVALSEACLRCTLSRDENGILSHKFYELLDWIVS